MPKRVAVYGDSPTWRRGIAAVLTDAGFGPVDCTSLGEWRPGRDGVAVVVDTGSRGASGVIEAFVDDHPHIPVIAVVDELTLTEYAAAVRSGAVAVVADDEPTEAYVTVLEAALQGRSAVPFSLARSLVSRVPRSPAPGEWVTEAEADWLRHLSEGKTVSLLAEVVGYSEREMFRMLGELYARIGVQNRTEAIIWASRQGVLEEPD